MAQLWSYFGERRHGRRSWGRTISENSDVLEDVDELAEFHDDSPDASISPFGSYQTRASSSPDERPRVPLRPSSAPRPDHFLDKTMFEFRRQCFQQSMRKAVSTSVDDIYLKKPHERKVFPAHFSPMGGQLIDNVPITTKKTVEIIDYDLQRKC